MEERINIKSGLNPCAYFRITTLCFSESSSQCALSRGPLLNFGGTSMISTESNCVYLQVVIVVHLDSSSSMFFLGYFLALC
jgi:hypothetical protein